jgi:hypothetical protein
VGAAQKRCCHKLAAVSGALFVFGPEQLTLERLVTDVTISAPTSSKRRPKDPAATIPLRDGDEGWTVPALAAFAQMSERSFRVRFVKSGLVKLARIGGVDFGSFDVVKGLVSDMIIGGEDPRPGRSRRRRR